MAETTKKAKAPAKPRATAATTKQAETRKQSVTGKVTASIPTHHEIAELARQYWAERGHQDGHAEQDWLRAERELLKLAS